MDDTTPGRIRKLKAALEYIPQVERAPILPGAGDPFTPAPEWMMRLENELQNTFENPFGLPAKSQYKPARKRPEMPFEAPGNPFNDPFRAPMWHASLQSPQEGQG